MNTTTTFAPASYDFVLASLSAEPIERFEEEDEAITERMPRTVTVEVSKPAGFAWRVEKFIEACTEKHQPWKQAHFTGCRRGVQILLDEKLSKDCEEKLLEIIARGMAQLHACNDETANRSARVWYEWTRGELRKSLNERSAPQCAPGIEFPIVPVKLASFDSRKHAQQAKKAAAMPMQVYAVVQEDVRPLQKLATQVALDQSRQRDAEAKAKHEARMADPGFGAMKKAPPPEKKEKAPKGDKKRPGK